MLAFLAAALLYVGATYAQTYLVGLGRPARAAGPAGTALRPPAVAVDRLLLASRAGVLISRITNDVQALDQLVTDGMATLFQSSLTLIGVVVILFMLDAQLALLTFLALPIWRRRAAVPDRLRRRLPAHARADRADHRLPAGDAVGHPRRALVRPGGPPR